MMMPYGEIIRSVHRPGLSLIFCPAAECISFESPIGVATGGVQPRLIKAEGSATSEAGHPRSASSCSGLPAIRSIEAVKGSLDRDRAG